MCGIKKRFILILVVFLPLFVHSQTLISTFIDPCTKKVSVFVFPISGGTTITFMGKSKVFTSADVRNATFMTWINQVYAEYSAPCPITTLANQITTTSVASSIAAAVPPPIAPPPPPPPPAPAEAPAASPPPAANSSSSSSSSSSESSSSNSSSDKSESKSESSQSSKSEKKEESKSEKKEEKKESKKEDKKKNAAMAPVIFSSDLSSVQQLQGDFNLMANIGLSQSSLAGDISYGGTAIIYSNLKQFALSTRYSKMELTNNQLCGIATYSYTMAYNNGSFMHIGAFSYVMMVKNNILGYNLAYVSTQIPYNSSTQMYGISSITIFGMHPMVINSKYSIAPELFIMGTPLSYAYKSEAFTSNSHLSYIIGNTFNFNISKRFSMTANVKYMGGQVQMVGLLIGSRFNL
jgi:hypothetical protein